VITDDTIRTYNTTASTSTTTGALTVSGGVGIGGDIYVGGGVIINTSLVETRITLVNTLDTTVVDSYLASQYRSCKSFIQIQDGVNFHITEIVLLHDNIGQVYKSEYGIISTGGEKGTFTADLQLDGIVRLYFTADAVSDKTIKVVKTAVAA
jgi:hypothetical protein